MDNCSGQSRPAAIVEAAERIKTDLNYFPSNATHLIQFCDSCFIQKLKRAWNIHWENYKLDDVAKCKWKDGSGVLQFLKSTFH